MKCSYKRAIVDKYRIDFEKMFQIDLTETIHNDQISNGENREEDTISAVKKNLFAISHIVLNNPILNVNDDMREMYFCYLKRYIKLGKWENRKYVKAQIQAYYKMLNIAKESFGFKQSLETYRYFLLFDLLHILGFDKKTISSNSMQMVIRKFVSDFPCMENETEIINCILDTVIGNCENWKKVKEYPSLIKNREYIELVERNFRFSNRKPFRILVTATMSAGKSMFINSLIGKYVSLSQNMACTSKIHSIIGKPFEDGFSYKHDYDIVLTATKKELLNNNKQNFSDKIIVSTYFNSILGGERIVINDSPGVNFSGDEEHKKITDRLIASKEYDLIIYLMNATQLGTNDEDEHLEYVKSHIGRKPVLFVMNKIDNFHIEEDDILAAIQNQMKYLQSKNFKNPMLCPVSSRAGYLAKISQYEDLNRVESRELNRYIDKFEQMGLVNYYKQHFPNIIVPDSEQEELQLLKNCGISYIEKILNTFCKGEKINVTNLC